MNVSLPHHDGPPRPAVLTAGPAELVLVRHGESEGNVARERAEAEGVADIDIALRDADVPLSRLGQQQAGRLRQALTVESTDQVWSSPYLRAQETARLATGRPALLDERLRDRELGVLDRLTSRGIRTRHPDEADRRRHLGKFYYRPPGGKSWADVALRLRSWAAELPGGRHVVFTHDAPIVLLRYVLERLTEAQVLELNRTATVGNASLTVLKRDAGAPWTCTSHGDGGHLGDLATTHPADSYGATGAGPR